MSVMQGLKHLARLEGHWSFAVGHDVNTQTFWMDLAINEGGRYVTCNVNIGRNSNLHRSRFLRLYLFGKVWFKPLDKKISD